MTEGAGNRSRSGSQIGGSALKGLWGKKGGGVSGLPLESLCGAAADCAAGSPPCCRAMAAGLPSSALQGWDGAPLPLPKSCRAQAYLYNKQGPTGVYHAELCLSNIIQLRGYFIAKKIER